MSHNTGDKARFGRERQKKMLRRERTLALRATLESKREEPVVTNSVEAESAMATAKLASTA